MSDALRSLPLACPIDGLALRSVERTLVCARAHAYDVSRHGHVNLLPVQFKPSRAPGDSAEMVAARRRVLDAGLFDPLADAVADRALAAIGGSRGTIVDAGCGEGFYTARIAGRLRERRAPDEVRVLGTDISVHAVKAAARRHRDVGWAVANNTRLPVVEGAADLVTSLFGFETWEPWAALQRRGQHVVVGHAGARHLIELREAIYADVRVHEPPSAAAAIAAGYAVTDERRVTFAANGVSASLLADVRAMTPHGHRASPDTEGAWSALLARAERAVGVTLTVDVVLRGLRRV